MQAFRIEWTESEAGWGIRPDGYSFHTTLEAAREYLATQFNNLSDKVPEEYSYPSKGWKEPAIAVPVEIPDDGILAKALVQKSDLRVFCSYADTPHGHLHEEARALKIVGEPVSVSYGEKGFTAVEEELLRLRREIGESLEEGKTTPARAIAESIAMIRYLGLD